jgi:uncharacterized RDD family membrane protein YckC
VKCPKCGYIGFEAVDRCRNCGYEFAFAATGRPQVPDLDIRSTNEADGPLVDLSLTGTDVSSAARRRTPTGKELDLDRIIGAPEAPADLPLFGAGRPAEELPPLVATPVSPRKPLAVRRMTPASARPRSSSLEGGGTRRNLELPLPTDVKPIPRAEEVEAAPPVPRILAAALDTLILVGIDAVVLYFTVRLSSLTLAEALLLPTVPMGAFFVMLNGGYLLAFTAAGGQTIGKMAFGLRVVGLDGGAVPVTAAALRAIACLLSTVCLGAGLVPALFGGRALHDRLADTRVVTRH